MAALADREALLLSRDRMLAFDGCAEDEAAAAPEKAGPQEALVRFGECAFRVGSLVARGSCTVLAEALPVVTSEALPVTPLVMRFYLSAASAGLFRRGWKISVRDLPPDARIMRPLGFSDDGRAILLHRYPVDLFSLLHERQDEASCSRAAWKAHELFRPLRAAADIADTVLLLHDRGVAHRDIKPENIMVSATGGIVLGDFDFAVACRRIDMARFSGTSAYLPPSLREEVARSRQSPVEGASYDAFEADAFAAAVTILDVLSKRSHEDPLECAAGLRHVGDAFGQQLEDALRVAIHAPCDEALRRLAERLRGVQS
jgi:hypothetical protein